MWAEAVSYYERAVEASPKDPDLMTDLGVCYQNLEEFDRALELFARAQEADPRHWQSLYNIVIVAGFNLGQLDQADAALQRLIEIQPSAPNIDRLRETLEHARAARESGGES
jgi:tetratricopeptide (TPR) repeat protein